MQNSKIERVKYLFNDNKQAKIHNSDHDLPNLITLWLWFMYFSKSKWNNFYNYSLAKYEHSHPPNKVANGLTWWRWWGPYVNSDAEQKTSICKSPLSAFQFEWSVVRLVVVVVVVIVGLKEIHKSTTSPKWQNRIIFRFVVSFSIWGLNCNFL